MKAPRRVRVGIARVQLRVESRSPGRLREWLWRRRVGSIWVARDHEANLAGHLPPEEHVTVHRLWIAEIYTPSLAAGMPKNLRALGVRVNRQDLAKWTKRLRDPLGGGSVNLGTIARPGTPVFGVDITRSDVPKLFDQVDAWLVEVTPSMSAVTLEFRVADVVSTRLESVLNAEYKTRVRAIDKGVRILDADHQRTAAADGLINELRDAAADWVAKRLPGHFAVRGGGIPRACSLRRRAWTHSLPMRRFIRGSALSAWKVAVTTSGDSRMTRR